MIDDWDSKVIKLFRDFSDEGFQRRGWFGIGPEVSSPAEMCCWLEDLDLDGWRIMREHELGTLLSRMITDFTREVDSISGEIDGWEIFSSSQWIKVRLMASVIRDVLEHKLKGL